MIHLLFATTNENKIKEAQEILGIKIKGIKLNIDEIQTFDPREAVCKKAYNAYLAYKKPVLVEDTSLFFESWNGLPGVFIDYFMESVGIKGLLKMLKFTKNRKAKAITYLGIYDGKKYYTFKGEIQGKISQKPKGNSGFGWDPIFVPKGFSKTFAQMTTEEKNKISMRKKALLKLKKEMKKSVSKLY